MLMSTATQNERAIRTATLFEREKRKRKAFAKAKLKAKVISKGFSMETWTSTDWPTAMQICSGWPRKKECWTGSEKRTRIEREREKT